MNRKAPLLWAALIAVIAYVEIRCVLTYRVVGAVSLERITILEQAPAGSRVVLPRYPIRGNTWWLGDGVTFDFVAADYGVAGVEVSGGKDPE